MTAICWSPPRATIMKRAMAPAPQSARGSSSNSIPMTRTRSALRARWPAKPLGDRDEIAAYGSDLARASVARHERVTHAELRLQRAANVGFDLSKCLLSRMLDDRSGSVRPSTVDGQAARRRTPRSQTGHYQPPAAVAASGCSCDCGPSSRTAMLARRSPRAAAPGDREAEPLRGTPVPLGIHSTAPDGFQLRRRQRRSPCARAGATRRSRLPSPRTARRR